MRAWLRRGGYKGEEDGGGTFSQVRMDKQTATAPRETPGDREALSHKTIWRALEKMWQHRTKLLTHRNIMKCSGSHCSSFSLSMMEIYCTADTGKANAAMTPSQGTSPYGCLLPLLPFHK